MKKIYDIFAKSKKQLKNPKQDKQLKIPIIIDTREKQSFVVSELIEKNAQIKFELLEIADYLIQDIAIERKTISDFISSMINKRLQKQLQEIKKYPRQFLIIEGFDFDYQDRRIHENALRGMFLSIITEFNIPIIFTQDSEDTATFLVLLAKKQEKILKDKQKQSELSIRQSRSFFSKEEQKQFILEGFQGIGPTTAKKLLQELKTLKNIFAAPKEILQEIIGKKADSFDILRR